MSRWPSHSSHFPLRRCLAAGRSNYYRGRWTRILSTFASEGIPAAEGRAFDLIWLSQFAWTAVHEILAPALNTDVVVRGSLRTEESDSSSIQSQRI